MAGRVGPGRPLRCAIVSVAERLKQLDLELPPPPRPLGAYVPTVSVGTLVFTSGQLPVRDGQLTAVGKVPAEVSLAEAAEAARQATLNALAAVANEIGGLDNVAQIVRLNVFVASCPGFADQATVANGASKLLTALFGDPGKHTRCAIGAAELPLNAPVELDLLVHRRGPAVP